MSFSKKAAEDDAGVSLDDDEADEIKSKSGGQYQQIRPEYTAMKNEYQNILKHSSKFGLTPGDRAKIFKDFGKKDEVDPMAELNRR
jgi:hypothetical protein